MFGSISGPGNRRVWPGLFIVSLLVLIFLVLYYNQFITTIHKTTHHRRTNLDPRTVQLKNPLSDNPIDDPRKIQQIESFRNKRGLIVSVHITHHAGTSLCHAFRKYLTTPSFACMADKLNWPPDAYVSGTLSRKYPWPGAETSRIIEKIHPRFRFLSWEFGKWGNIHSTEWENERLVSMIVMRDPLERFLAGGKCGVYHDSLPKDPTPRTQDLYWEYANSRCALNFAMRVLTAKDYERAGDKSGEEELEEAKVLLKRFTFVIDQACLTQSMKAVGKELNILLDDYLLESTHHRHESVRERLGNDTLYEYVKHRFRYDIALYEFAKTLSIIKCN